MNAFKCLAAAAAVSAAALTADARAAGLLIADNGLGGVLEIKEQDVKVTINNGVAVTTVDQVFTNTESRQVEALYTFPVPKGASVSNFSMWINGKEMVGEVVEKKRAREIYNSYKQVRRDPGLLEQIDYRTFEMRVFPIAPKADQHVQIVYYQELDYDHDRATYVYPLATNTKPTANSKTTGKFALSVDVKSEVPITEMESTSHPKDFAIAKHTPNYSQASLETRGGDLSRDVVISFQTERARTGIDLIASRPRNEDGYFSLTLTAGEELAKVNKPMDYVFVLDVSGSMNEDRKLELSEQSLGAFIAGLATEDRFEVMTFNVQPHALFGSMTPADDTARQKAKAFLASQEAKGGTILNNAMTAAYKYAESGRALNVIILSDGLAQQDERAQLAQLIQQRPTDTRVFAIGVGNDVNRGLLEQMANDSGGLAAFVSREDNLARQAQAFRQKLLRPAITDVAIKIDGVSAAEFQPAKLPNLYYGMPVRLYGRYAGSGEGKVTVSGMIEGKPFSQGVELDFPKNDDTNPEIERMWAMKKVDSLLKLGDAQGSRQPYLDQIVRLGEGYSIVTEYTSFLVLENDAEYQRWHIDRRNVLRVDRDRAAQARVAQGLDALRTSAAADLGPAGVEKAQQVAAIPAQQVQAPVARPSAPTPQMAPATPAAPQVPESPRNRDLGIPMGNGAGGHGGGGAIDPLTGAAAMGLVAVLVLGCRKWREEA
jgi:Ca-activated chloride channel family protein